MIGEQHTTRGLQLANSQGIPIYTIDQSNASTLIPALNVFPSVQETVQEDVDAGYTIVIPADTLVMNLWAGSVWIDQNANGTGYLIEGGMFGGSTTQDPGNRQNPQPTCSSISDELNADSGRFPSAFFDAVAYKESTWTQFDADGDPVVNQNINRKGQVTSAGYGIMQVEDNHDGETITLASGKVTVSDTLLENTTSNIDIGSYYFTKALNKATSQQTAADAQNALNLLNSVNSLVETYLTPNQQTTAGLTINTTGLSQQQAQQVLLLAEAYGLYNAGEASPPLILNGQANPDVSYQELQHIVQIVNDYDSQAWLSTQLPGCTGPVN